MKILSFLAMLTLAGQASAADDGDLRLLAEIARIRAIDNHSHDDPADPQRGGEWKLEDPLGAAEYPDVVPLRRNSDDWLQAWSALYGYRHHDMEPAHLRELLATKQRLLRESGELWPTIVLDKAGVDIALVNARVRR